MFTGEYRHSIDAKGRVAVPARFRAELARRRLRLALDRQLPGDLPAPGLGEDLADRVAAKQRYADAGARTFSRFLFSGAFEVELDGQGRVVLPPGLRDFAGLKGRPWWSARAITSSCGSPPLGRLQRGDDLARCPRRAPRRVSASSAPNEPPGSGGTATNGMAALEEGHLPVMVEEVLDGSLAAPGQPPDRCHRWRRRARPSGSWRRNSPDGRLLGLDADQAAIARSAGPPGRRSASGRRCGRRTSSSSTRSPAAAGFGAVDGILFDLGLSSYQLADAERAFSFRADGPLDMRFDTCRGAPASDLLADLDETRAGATSSHRMARNRIARRIARAIVAAAPASADRDRRPAGRARRARRRPRLLAAAVACTPRRASSRHCGSRSTGSSRSCRARWPARSTCSARWPAGGHRLPLARGPHRQALHRRGAARLHLPTGGAGLRLRSVAPTALGRPHAGPPVRRRDRRQPSGSERTTPGCSATRGLRSPSTHASLSTRHPCQPRTDPHLRPMTDTRRDRT